MCLLPNRRASIERAPGPIMANVAPSAANMIEDTALPAFDHRIQPLATATNVPATGVHRPTKRSEPATAPTSRGTIAVHSLASDRQMIP